jgi:diketogulonate reductase-like aldo/keto reductase
MDLLYLSLLVQFQPRFTGENLEKNEVLRAQAEAIAAKKGCSLNQLAHAWVLHNGNDVVPIPGTTKKVNLESNIGMVGDSLSKEEIKEIEAAVLISEVAGDRYHEDVGLKGTWHLSKPHLFLHGKAPRWHRDPQQNK